MKTLLLFMLSVFSTWASAQDTQSQNNFHQPVFSNQCGHAGEIEDLLTQQSVDDFKTKYKGCTEYLGSIGVGDGVSNLNGLSNLEKIDGFLQISSFHLVDLRGLEQLQSVGLYLGINDNKSLLNFNGIGGLTYAEAVYILDNRSLNDISELKVKGTTGDTVVRGNPALEDVSSASNAIAKVEQKLFHSYYHVGDNGRVNEIGSLVTDGGQLNAHIRLINEANITNADFLQDVTQINGDLELINLSNLASLTGLKNLTDISGSLQIISDTSLKNLDGLQNLSPSFSGKLIISNDSGLTDCLSLCPLVQNGHVSFEGDNGTCMISLAKCS